MDNYELSFDILQYRLKSARRKKRLQKTDFDKQIIQVKRKQNKLWKARMALPMVPLETPYQKGWKRHFVLREDMKRSPSAAFYQSILEKINTVQYHAEKSFKLKKKRKRRKINAERKQYLKEFSEWEWNHHSQKLTEEEKFHFHLYEFTSKNGKETLFRYRFNEPWRYVLQVKPHIITEVRMVDELLERELKHIENQITTRHLRPKIDHLTGGTYRGRKIVTRDYRNSLSKVAFDSQMEECEYKQQF